MPGLASQSYIFDPRPNYPFSLVAKRYWDPASPYTSDADALTLIFVHGTGFHKEQWEPTIEDLYDAAGNKVQIREAWSIDTPNHGDAALLNEQVLRQGYDTIFSWQEKARAVHAFLSGLGTGVDVDFSTRNLVAIGHSSGAVALMLATTYHPPIKYKLLHLVEPMILPYTGNSPNFLEAGAAKRRDIWPSREEAFKSFKSRPSWQVWDERVLRIYVEHGLRPLPTAEYPDKTNGVTLKCTRTQEAACYRDRISYTLAYRFLPIILKRLPVHILYGAVDDHVPREIKDDVLNNASRGVNNFASVTRVEGAGHLVVQTHPKELAYRILNVLLYPLTSPETKAKL